MSIIECARYNSAAQQASAIVKASAGLLLFLHVYNANAAARWLQVFDAAALPADNAIPLLTFPVAIAGTYTLNLAPLGLPMRNGIIVCNSTTGPTKTIGAADSLFTVGYQ